MRDRRRERDLLRAYSEQPLLRRAHGRAGQLAQLRAVQKLPERHHAHALLLPWVRARIKRCPQDSLNVVGWTISRVLLRIAPVMSPAHSSEADNECLSDRPKSGSATSRSNCVLWLYCPAGMLYEYHQINIRPH